MTARHRSQVLVAAIAAATLFAACGAEESTSSSPASAADDDGLRPPVAVNAIVASASTGGDAATMSSESAASTDLSIMPAFGGFTYEVGEGLPALPLPTTAYQYAPGSEADEAAVAALAAALGVATPPEHVDDETTGLLWRAGPDDGTAPSLVVSADPQLSWSYSGAWTNQTMPSACGEVVEADGGDVAPADASTTTVVVGGDAVVGGSEPCPAPEPPEGVPAAAEVEAVAADLLAAIGEDPAAYELETYADEWVPSVSAWPWLDGVRSPVSWGFGFGADGVLQWADGSLADPLPAGPYPLVDLDAALVRLREQSSPSIMSSGGAIGDLPAPATTMSTPADAPIAVDPPAPAIDPGVVPEPEVATLVDVRADFWWAWDADGSVWLLPAYTFTDTEDRQHTVPAVTDEFLIVAETPPTEPSTGVPATIEPIEPTTTPVGPLEPTTTTSMPGVPLDPAPTVDPALLLGLTVDEADTVLAELGLTLRVVREDGVDLSVTEDFSETRVNVAIKSGTVTDVVSLG